MLRRIDAPPGFEALYDLREPEIGLRAFIALHSTARGPGFGGIRRVAYADLEAARADVLALAEAMSHKLALADLPAGGAKSVIVDDEGLDVDEAYRAMGRAVESLGGLYVCGPDVGTGAAELELLREATEHVNPPENDAGLSTAAGVLAALKGALRASRGEEPFRELRVAVEGLGSVGGAVARELLDGGAQVFGYDIDPARLNAARADGVEVAVSTEALRELKVDVWMPCAMGRGIDEDFVEHANARWVCGSANNQLAHPGVDRLLYDAGIAWVPDVLANVGAVAEGVITVARGQGSEARDEVARCLGAVEENVAKLMSDAREQGRPTGEVALEMARARLAESV